MHFLLYFVAYSVYDGPKYVGCMQKNTASAITAVVIAIPGSRDPESRDPGRFSNPEIPGFSHPQSRDFEIIKITNLACGSLVS